MTIVLAPLSVLCVSVLVAAVCLFVRRIELTVRSAEESVTILAALTAVMRRDGAVISPGIESMNQNLYRVAMHLGQLGEATEDVAGPVEHD